MCYIVAHLMSGASTVYPIAEHLLLGLAATGVTTFAAAGDHGVAGCWPGSDEPLAAYPASSPYATAVGGTSFITDGDRIVGEEAWRDTAAEASGGGGESGRFGLPDYQDDAGIDGDHRRYPDIASYAAIARLNSIPTCDAVACTWAAIGGTSAPAPTLAATFALVLSASERAGGPGRLGWVNLLLTGEAAREGGSITDIVDGSTALLGNECCDAVEGYDEATGWGTIDAFDDLTEVIRRYPPNR
jgi:subtilase family serine protease